MSLTTIKKKAKGLFFIFKNIIFQPFRPFKGFNMVDLLIFDDIYPHPISGFRFEEYTVLLSIFSKSKIILNPTAYPLVKTDIGYHKQHIKEIINSNYKLKNKLQIQKGYININTKLFYCVFINNIFNSLNWLEKYKIPFVFTLYPGGGFQMDDENADSKLRRVFMSKMFRKVIVTQKITLDYLVNKNFCKNENIEFIFGGVVPQISLVKDISDKKNYLLNKKTFDICFCAAKYTPRGEDKGYDTFIEFAHQIAKKYNFIRFHIIGGFNKDDIDINQIQEKIFFYGYLDFKKLSTIYKKMDILISPNKPFILAKGGFDGFPLGTVVEAALNGVVVLISDYLSQNSLFTPDEDLIIIDSSSNSIEKEVVKLIENPNKLKEISEKGRQKFMKVYSNEMQMKPRIELLKKEISKI